MPIYGMVYEYRVVGDRSILCSVVGAAAMELLSLVIVIKQMTKFVNKLTYMNIFYACLAIFII